ncbi:MAG TPA: hypothetical protein VGB85_03020 [Nannocystis sp.]
MRRSLKPSPRPPGHATHLRSSKAKARGLTATISLGVCIGLHASIAAAAPGTLSTAGTGVPRTEDGAGIKIGPRSLLHPGFALLIGGDSNVFWNRRQDVGGLRPAAIVMPVAWIGIGNREVRDNTLQTPPEASERRMDYNLRVTAGYRAYLAGAEDIRKLPRFSVDLNAFVVLFPGRRFSVGFTEFFSRIADPRNYDAGIGFNYNRVDHRGALGVTLRPGGGRLSLSAAYTNEVLYYQSQDIYSGDRLVQGATTEVKWRLLPRSSLVLNYSFAHSYYLSCNAEVDLDCKEDNNAHRVMGGFRGQIGARLTLDALAGYGAGIYYDDENGPNFKNFIGVARLAYYPTLRTQLFAQLDRQFSDSLFGNYFVDAGGRIGGLHQWRWKMFTEVGFSVVGRRYAGLPIPGSESRVVAYFNAPGFVRKDTILTLSGRVEQPFGRYFVLGARYDLVVDRTDFAARYRGGLIDAGGFVKHVAFLVGAVRF